MWRAADIVTTVVVAVAAESTGARAARARGQMLERCAAAASCTSDQRGRRASHRRGCGVSRSATEARWSCLKNRSRESQVSADRLYGKSKVCAGRDGVRQRQRWRSRGSGRRRRSWWRARERDRGRLKRAWRSQGEGAHRVDVHAGRLGEADDAVVGHLGLADDALRARVGEEEEVVDADEPELEEEEW